MKRSSRARLTPRHLGDFPGDTLHDRVARAVCEGDCLPRKEFFESWEVARRVRRRHRGGRVVELAAGHGLLAMLLLLLDDSSPSALCVDRTEPPSFHRLLALLTAAWPRLEGRITFHTGDIREVDVGSGDLVASVHACGTLSDHVIDIAVAAGARLALVPCCHDLERNDLGPLGGWLPGPVAIDAMRAVRLEGAGYEVRTHAIPEDITPANRLLIATPGLQDSPRSP